MKTNFDYTGGVAAFIEAYEVCALWSTNDESDDTGGVPLDDNFGPDDIAPQTRADMAVDCHAFCHDNALLLADWNASQAGHDFWLTRNRHGAGFWDRGLTTGDALTAACRPYGGVDLYVGADGMVYA